jgi:hypothetical protein
MGRMQDGKAPMLFASTGFAVLTSIFMPINVLISDRASAPPCRAAFAVSVISVTLGESFTIRGTLHLSLTLCVISFTIAGLVRKLSLLFNVRAGYVQLYQVHFIAEPPAISQFSSIVPPEMLAIIFVSNF